MTPEERMKRYCSLYKRVVGEDVSIIHEDGFYKVDRFFYNREIDIDRIVLEMEDSLNPPTS